MLSISEKMEDENGSTKHIPVDRTEVIFTDGYAFRSNTNKEFLPFAISHWVPLYPIILQHCNNL